MGESVPPAVTRLARQDAYLRWRQRSSDEGTTEDRAPAATPAPSKVAPDLESLLAAPDRGSRRGPASATVEAAPRPTPAVKRSEEPIDLRTLRRPEQDDDRSGSTGDELDHHGDDEQPWNESRHRAVLSRALQVPVDGRRA